MDLNRFLLLGVTHETFDLIGRENFIKSAPQKLLQKLHLEKKIKGYIFLPTCLRGEMYIELNSEEDNEEIKSYFQNVNLTVVKKGEEAILYFFKLVCGFNSVIKGEDQILSQIKEAYLKAMNQKHSSRLLNIIFNKGVALGKEFRHRSNIAKNGLSTEGLSVVFLNEITKNTLKDKKILILGVGELARGLLRILKKAKCKNITITNRTHKKAVEIKDEFSCQAVDFKDKYLAIKNSDIIISATSAPHFVIKKSELEEFLPGKNINEEKSIDSEKIFLDLAVPRDIDPSISELGNILVHNLDDILEIYHRNKINRENIIKEYMYLLDKKIIEVKNNINRAQEKEKLIIGSRGSILALAQSEYVKSLLESKFKNLHCEIKVIVTSGDRDLNSNYKNSSVSLKSFFTKEIEQELLDGKIDIAVHSMKDMPSISPPGLILGAIPIREDNRDVFVSTSGKKLSQMSPSSIIGTSSLRRVEGVKKLRPDIEIKAIRGNIHTRLEKLARGEYDGIILAAAGLKRVGLGDRITEYLNIEDMVPAPAQGALHIQCRENDELVKSYLSEIHDKSIEETVMIEREFSKIFDGGCHTPMGCAASVVGDEIHLLGNYYKDGVEYKESIKASRTLGIEIANILATKIKEQINEKG